MDEIRIESKQTKQVIGNVLRKSLSNKIANFSSIEVNELHITIDENGKAHAHLSIDAELPKEEVTKVFKKFS